jgi:hypothetical protein
MPGINHPLLPGGYYGQVARGVSINPAADSEVIYNPNYYHTAGGQAELKQRGISNTEEHIRNLQTELQRQSQMVSDGSQIYTQEDLSNRRLGMENAISELTGMAPLAAAGILSPTDVNVEMKKSAMGDIADQRNIRKAAREVQAITSQIANGTFTEKMGESAIKSLQQNWGENVLAGVQGYAQLAGMGDEIQQARIERTQQFAKQQGIDASWLKWDNENDRPVLDPHTVAIQQFKSQQEQLQTEQADKLVTNKRKGIEAAMIGVGSQMKAVSALITAQTKGGSAADPALVGVMKSLATENNKISKQLRGGTEQDTVQPAVNKPLSQASSYPSFGSMDSFITAMKNGSHKVGTPGLVNGVLWSSDLTGKVRRVR